MPADGTDPLDPPSIAIAAATARDVKLPTFCAADAISWFQRAEVQFRLKCETSSTCMADHVLAALPEDVFPLISGWLTERDGADIQYDELKKHLLRKFVATPEERADKLLTLSHQPLGDQRPSIAFQEMKALTRLPAADGSTKTLDLLRILWLLRLPDDVRRGITNFSDISEDELTKLADSLQGANRGTSSRSAMAANDDEVPQPLTQEWTDEDAAAATPSQHRRWAQAPTKKPHFKQPPRGPPPRKATMDLCFYHSRFGHDARNCRAPCSWTKNL